MVVGIVMVWPCWKIQAGGGENVWEKACSGSVVLPKDSSQ